MLSHFPTFRCPSIWDFMFPWCKPSPNIHLFRLILVLPLLVLLSGDKERIVLTKMFTILSFFSRFLGLENIVWFSHWLGAYGATLSSSTQSTTAITVDIEWLCFLNELCAKHFLYQCWIRKSPIGSCYRHQSLLIDLCYYYPIIWCCIRRRAQVVVLTYKTDETVKGFVKCILYRRAPERK